MRRLAIGDEPVIDLALAQIPAEQIESSNPSRVARDVQAAP